MNGVMTMVMAGQDYGRHVRMQALRTHVAQRDRSFPHLGSVIEEFLVEPIPDLAGALILTVGDGLR